MTTMEIREQTKEFPYLRSNFLGRQEKERHVLDSLYKNMPVGIEQRFLSVAKVADSVGLANSIIDNTLRNFERAGILFRRLEFGAKNDKGIAVHGRSYHWTLLTSHKEAVERLEKFHREERVKYNRPPMSMKSLKSRILNALNEHQKFDTIDDLFRAVRRNNENLDFHNLTHVMESLVKQGKIAFDRDKTKDKVPYNIRLTKNGAMPKAFSEVVKKPEDTFTPEQENTYIEALAEEVIPLAEVVHRIVHDYDEYPTIMSLIKRREHLEQAARLAESAQEDDVAILLLDRAKKPLSKLEDEAIKLFEAYKTCRES